jgi:hypothetical protein
VIRKNRKSVLTGSAAALLALASLSAQAVAIYGTSTGSFLATSNCAAPKCQIINSSAGPNSEVVWIPGYPFSYSALAADPFSFSTGTGAKNVVVGELTWVNNAIYGLGPPNTSGIDWLLSVAFVTPGSTSGVQLFNVDIANPLSPTANGTPGIGLSDLGNLSFSLAGILVNDFRYTLIQPTSTLGDCRDSYWGGCGSTWGALLVTADFTALARSVGVPEPASLFLLGGGLLAVAGAVAVRRRSVPAIG